MKLIELLTKIANEESIPQKIKVGGEEFEFDKLENYYKRDNGDDLLELCTVFPTDEFMNMDVEVIENDTEEIEELNDTCYDVNNMSDEELEYYHNKTRTVINELIRVIKKLEKRIQKLEED